MSIHLHFDRFNGTVSGFLRLFAIAIIFSIDKSFSFVTIHSFTKKEVLWHIITFCTTYTNNLQIIETTFHEKMLLFKA